MLMLGCHPLIWSIALDPRVPLTLEEARRAPVRALLAAERVQAKLARAERSREKARTHDELRRLYGRR